MTMVRQEKELRVPRRENPYGDEIDLVDVFRVLWKRKKLIVLGTILLTVVAAGGSYLLPKVYVVTTIIEPGKRPISDESGQVTEEKVMESPEAIKEAVLGGAFDESIRKKLQIPADVYPKIKANVPKDTDLVKLSIESPKPQRAKAVLEEIVARITSDVENKIELEKNRIQSDIKMNLVDYQGNLDQMTLLADQVKETDHTIKALEADRKKALSSRANDAMAVLLYSNEIQTNQIYLNELQGRLKEFEKQSEVAKIKVERLQLNLDRIKATKVHKLPTISPKPVKPKKLLIVALTFVMGLMGTTVVAFLLEYVQQAGEVSEKSRLSP